MGNCVSVNKKKVEPKKAITLAIVGLDNAGKTTLSSVLSGEQPDPNIAPTVGFRNVKFTSCQCEVTAYDVGGGRNIRPIWRTYYGEVYGILFVVDSTSMPRLKEARDVFKETLGNPKVSGKPVLILANKVDKEEHMKETEIFKALDIEKTVNSNNCPSKLVMVSALKGSGSKMDKEIQEGLTWLLNEIKKSWATLSSRVQKDMADEKMAKEKEREERKARVKRQREEREKAEKLERTALGLKKRVQSDDDDDDIVGGNPFKALDLQKLEKKEKLLKEEKRLKEERLMELSRGDNLRKTIDHSPMRRNLDDVNKRRSLDDLDAIQYSRLSSEKLRVGPRMGLTSYDLADSQVLHSDSANIKPSALSLLSRNNRGQTLPPLEQPSSSDSGEKKLRKKKKKLTDYNFSANDKNDERNRGNNPWNSGNYESSLYNKESGVHDLTPRNAKPKMMKIVKSSKIDEEDEGFSNQENFRSRKGLYDDDNDALGYQTVLKPYKLDVKSLEKENSRKGYETYPRNLDMEESAYHKSLKRINPPNVNRFDEKKDVEESSEKEEVSDDDRPDYLSYQHHHSKMKPIMNHKKVAGHTLHRNELDDEGYSQDSILKDTLRFPRDEDQSSTEDSTRDLHKEIRDIQELYGTVGFNNRSKSKRKTSKNDKFISRSADFGHENLQTSPQKPETRKKKKLNIFRSNKLAPSDDDADSSVSDKVTSPRLVQETIPRSKFQSDIPPFKGNSRVTQFHRNVPKDIDVSSKWGLAEELPSIEDSYTQRKIPNFDDSDNDDIVF